MSYADVNTPVIERITLPSGNTYYIADREIRDVVDALSQTVAGGVSFIIAWDGVSTPSVGQIPAGVVVNYNGTNYTGTLSAETSGAGAHAQAGAFYLVKSATSAGNKDVYDEYVPVGAEGNKTWEKIGDTLVELTDIVTNVSLTKQTDTVIGTDATFTVTQPTIALATDSSSGTGKVQVVTGITSVAASGDEVTALTGLGTPSTSNVLTGAKPKENSSSVTNAVQYVKSQGTATTTKLSASVNLGTPSTSNVASSVTPTTKKLATGSVTGVQASTTTASKATAGTAQTTADGTWTAVASGANNANDNLLANISVSNGILTIGAATLDTQSTPQYTFSDVTVPIKAASATTVATGGVTTTGSGADIVTDVAVGDTVAAVTGYASPTATIASGTDGDVTVATGIGAATTRYLTIDANGTAAAVTGYANPTTDTVLGSSSTIEVTPTKTYIKATASGANTAWNNKDSVTVLKDTTDVSVTKGTV